MKVGLLLEGGAMRGMYTAGVLDVLLENNIKVDCIMAVSAGALFGVNFKSRQKGRAYRFNLKYINDKRYFGMYSLITTGNILNQEFCFKDIPNILDDFNYASFKRTKEDFYAVVTNINTGKAEYIKIDDLKKKIEYLRASGSMPFVSKPVKIDGNEYLDGGIADAIPIKKMMQMGLDKIIVVLTRPKEYRKKKQDMTLAKILYKKYPKLVKTMEKRYKIYNDSIDEIEFLKEENDAFLIRPSKYIKIKRVEKNEEVLTQMYNLGVSDATTSINELKEYLK
jgi:predicted patatin/cPLA2 family phospholipase